MYDMVSLWSRPTDSSVTVNRESEVQAFQETEDENIWLDFLIKFIQGQEREKSYQPCQ